MQTHHFPAHAMVGLRRSSLPHPYSILVCATRLAFKHIIARFDILYALSMNSILVKNIDRHRDLSREW